MKAIKLIISCFFVLASFFDLNAQNNIISGEVTFITSSNLYVRFHSTNEIGLNDTLYSVDANGIDKPCLQVVQKSSTSCVCTILNNCDLEVGNLVKAKPSIKKEEIKIPNKKSKVIESELTNEEDEVDTVDDFDEEASTEKIYGRVSASSYSFFDGSEKNHRIMTRASINAEHIGNSNFSLEGYGNYRQNIESSSENSTASSKFFRVYNLALMYEVDTTLSITLGRKTSRKMSSIGAIDGLQVDKLFGNFYTGLVVGFRPDIVEYNLNPNLLEYGIYVGQNVNIKNVYGQITFGILEQRNLGSVDRRYAYLQNSLSFSRRTSLFASMEVDWFDNIGGVVGMNPRLTNMFVSTRFRLNSKISATVSYDSRKRIIYYETFKTEVERLLEDDEARQGVRLRVNIKPFKYITGGIAYGKRFQDSSNNKSDNINGYLSLARIPGLSGRLSVNVNLNKSNYLESRIVSIRHYRSIIRKVLDADFYFRLVDYKYLSIENTVKQTYYGANLSFRVSKKVSLNVLTEYTKYRDESKIRLNTKLIKRFS